MKSSLLLFLTVFISHLALAQLVPATSGFYNERYQEKQVKKVIGDETEFYDSLGRLSGILEDADDYLDSTNVIYSGAHLEPDSTVRFFAYYDIQKGEAVVAVTHTHYFYDENRQLLLIKEFSHTDSLYKEIRYFPGAHGFGPDSAKFFYAIDSTFPYGMPDPEGKVELYSEFTYKYDKDGNLVEELSCQALDDFCALTKYKYNKSGKLIEKQTKRGPLGNLMFTQKVTLTKYEYNKKGQKKLVKTRHSAGDPMSSFSTYYKVRYRCNGLIKRTITAYNAEKSKAKYKYYFH